MSRRKDAARVVLPTVNLLPESAFVRMRARRLRRRFVVGGVTLVLLVGAAWGFQHVRVAEARKLVAVEQAETDRLTSQTELLAPVRTYVDGVEVQESTVRTAMVDEVYLSEVLEGVRAAAPAGADVASVSVTITGTAVGTAADPAAGAADPGSACPGPDPFNTRVVVGCVTLAGTATSRAEVGEMVVQLGRSSLFVEPFISTTTTGEATEVSFSGSVGLSEKVFSNRYAADANEGGA